jgi:hypothetical protein
LGKIFPQVNAAGAGLNRRFIRVREMFGNSSFDAEVEFGKQIPQFQEIRVVHFARIMDFWGGSLYADLGGSLWVDFASGCFAGGSFQPENRLFCGRFISTGKPAVLRAVHFNRKIDCLVGGSFQPEKRLFCGVARFNRKIGCFEGGSFQPENRLF